jgi:DNA integrity scanning protein DisA with diadenylate cyclase activity
MASSLSDFIRRRLKEKGIKLVAGLANAVIEELERAIEPPEHEGALQTYGAVIAFQRAGTLMERVGEIYGGEELPLDIGSDYRNVVDGGRSFFCRYVFDRDCPSESRMIWISGNLYFFSEDSLSSLRERAVLGSQNSHCAARTYHQANELIIVHRNRDGDVRLLCRSGVLKITRGIWKKRLNLEDYKLEEYIKRLNIGLNQRPPLHRVFMHILDVAVHQLGAQGIGATLMVEGRVDEFAPSECDLLKSNVSTDVSGMNLVVCKKAHQDVISHLLTHNDGAAIFSSAGKLISIKNWISMRYNNDDALRNRGGTRHLSAILASRRTILPVITISSDGPVKAYHHGNQITPQDVN